MKILIADDDPVILRTLEAKLTAWGHEVVSASDGAQSMRILEGPDAPALAILDWSMPHPDGLSVCRAIREVPALRPTYVIMLTVRDSKSDTVVGLEAGADDYIVKPCNFSELRARVGVGARVVALQQELARRLREMEDVRAGSACRVCPSCRRLRDEQGRWHDVEAFLRLHGTAAPCPDCAPPNRAQERTAT